MLAFFLFYFSATAATAAAAALALKNQTWTDFVMGNRRLSSSSSDEKGLVARVVVAGCTVG